MRMLLWPLAVLLSSAAIAASPPTPAPVDRPPADTPFGSSAKVAGPALAEITGRADTAVSIRANNSSTVSNNSVTGSSVTGTISFDTSSFANLSGLSLLSANTGNNVSINSSLNLNVAIQR